MVRLCGIPTPPSLNNAYPSNRFGRRFKSREFQTWERDFRIWCLENAKVVNEARQEFSKGLPGHFVVIDSEFYFPKTKIITLQGTPKKNDTTNRIKILHDAIAGAIWLDDSWFFDGVFTKRPTNMVEYCNVGLRWIAADWMFK